MATAALNASAKIVSPRAREADPLWRGRSLPTTISAFPEPTAIETAQLRRLDDALAELEVTENRWYEAEIHRIRAEILLKRDPANTAAAEQLIPGNALSRVVASKFPCCLQLLYQNLGVPPAAQPPDWRPDHR